MNRAQNHNPSNLASITLKSHMPHFEQILAESICQEKRYHSVPYLYYWRLDIQKSHLKLLNLRRLKAPNAFINLQLDHHRPTPSALTRNVSGLSQVQVTLSTPLRFWASPSKTSVLQSQDLWSDCEWIPSRYQSCVSSFTSSERLSESKSRFLIRVGHFTNHFNPKPPCLYESACIL